MNEKNLEIKHHNYISEATFNYTAKELDLFCYLISNLYNSNGSTILDSKKIREITGYSRKSYKLFERFLDRMGSKPLVLNQGPIREKYYVFDKLKFDDENMTIEVKLTESISSFVLNLKSHFNTYRFEEFVSLKKIHSKRLYQLLKRHQYSKLSYDFILTLEEIKTSFNIRTKGFNRTNNILGKVINPSIEEINLNTNFNINIEKIYDGRYITGIRFEVKERIKKSKELLDAIELAKRNIYISRSGLLSKNYSINKLINRFGLEELEEGLKYAYRKINKKFTSLNYLIKVIESSQKPKEEEYIKIKPVSDYCKDIVTLIGAEPGTQKAIHFTEEQLTEALRKAEADNVSREFLLGLKKRSPRIFRNTIKNYI